MTTNAYALEAKFAFDAEDGEAIPGDLTTFFDDVVTHLERLGSVEDLMLGVDEDSRQVTIQLVVPAAADESIESVVGTGMGAIRTAFHACEAQTAGWPKFPEVLMYINIYPEPATSDLDGIHTRELADA